MNAGEKKVGAIVLISAGAMTLFVFVLALGRHLADRPDEGEPGRVVWEERLLERIKDGEGGPAVSADEFDRGLQGMHFEAGYKIIGVTGTFLALVEGQEAPRLILKGSGQRRIDCFPMETEWERLREWPSNSKITVRGVVDSKNDRPGLYLVLIED